MGVDEDVTHLADDIDKLLNSEIPHAYIVHFLRESYLGQVCDSLVVRPGGNVHVTSLLSGYKLNKINWLV